MKVGLYARVSTHDQQTLRLQLEAMRKYARQRKWTVALEIKDIGSGASERATETRRTAQGCPKKRN